MSYAKNGNMNAIESIEQRETRSFLMAREPSVDRLFRPCPQMQVRLFDDISEETSNSGSSTLDYAADTSSNELSCDATKTDGALVYLRMRPVPLWSSAYSVSDCGTVLSTRAIGDIAGSVNNKNTIEKQYSFSAIYDSTISQKDIYGNCIGEKIKSEECFTILAYGTSGSGKTFTLLGDGEQPGIIPRSIENIFACYGDKIHNQPCLKLLNNRLTILVDDLMDAEDLLRRQILGGFHNFQTQHVEQQKIIQAEHNFETLEHGDISVFVWVSFVEIYNEAVHDLLEPPGLYTQQSKAPPLRKKLKIVGNDGKVFVKGLTSVFVKSSVEALRLLHCGQKRVTYASTAINANSSRSHCIFFVDLLKYCHESGETTQTSYKFCDLAGSERLIKTGNIGSRLKEAQSINTSLMILGRCIDAAITKKPNDIIPYRESKLTMLLQAALLGKEKLAMIVNITPTDQYYEENLNVLSFASIAKNIVFKQPNLLPKKKSRFSLLENRKQHIESIIQENNMLKEELALLKSEIEEMRMRQNFELIQQEHDLRNDLVNSFQKTLAEHKEEFQNELKRQLEIQERIHMSKINSLKRRFEQEMEDLREELLDARDELLST